MPKQEEIERARFVLDTPGLSRDPKVRATWISRHLKVNLPEAEEILRELEAKQGE